MDTPDIDDDVPIRRHSSGGRPKSDPYQDPLAATLLELDVDKGKNSFYLPGAGDNDITRVRRLAKRLGVNLISRKFPAGADSLRREAGVRFWRMTPKDDDDF